jgi:hypothetical protein
MFPFYFSVEQITVDPLIRLPKRPPPKSFDERGEFKDRFGNVSIYLRRLRLVVPFSLGPC